MKRMFLLSSNCFSAQDKFMSIIEKQHNDKSLFIHFYESLIGKEDDFFNYSLKSEKDILDAKNFAKTIGYQPYILNIYTDNVEKKNPNYEKIEHFLKESAVKINIDKITAKTFNLDMEI